MNSFSKSIHFAKQVWTFSLLLTLVLLYACGNDNEPVPEPEVLGSIVGSVKNGNQTIAGASISLSGNGETLNSTSDQSGGFIFKMLALDNYNLTVSAEGFEMATTNIALTTEGIKQINIDLLIQRLDFNGTVADISTALPLDEVTLNASQDNELIQTVKSNTDGEFTFTQLEVGNYEISILKEGYTDTTIVYDHNTSNSVNSFNIEIKKLSETLINNVLSDELLAIVEKFDIEINKGTNPPNLENTYFISPLVLDSSSRSTDVIGSIFLDYTFQITEQNNEDLSLTYYASQENLTESEGKGGFITGENNSFSIFVEDKAIRGDKIDSAISVIVISGKLIEGGIENLKLLFILTDDFGDPNEVYIEIGDTRLFSDSDGFSPEVDIDLSDKSDGRNSYQNRANDKNIMSKILFSEPLIQNKTKPEYSLQKN